MKLIFHDLTSPLLLCKCGSAAAGLPLVGDLLGFAENERTNETNEDIAHLQMRNQQIENQLNRDWQTGEAEKNRQFQVGQTQQAQSYQTSEREASQAYQSQQWQRQFAEEQSHKFDVPAGFNPAVYFSSNGAASASGGSVSAPSGNAPSAPNGAMPGSVQGLSPVPFQARPFDVGSVMSGAGALINSLASAKKMGAETDELLKTMAARVRTAFANADNAEQIATLSKIHVAVQEAKLPYRFKMAEAEYQELLAKIDLTKQEKLTSGEQAALYVATAKMNAAIQELDEKEKEKLGIELQYLPNLIKSQILSNRGSAAASYSEVGKNKAITRNQNSQAALNEFQNIVNRNTQSDIEESVRYQTENLKKQGVILDWQADAAQSAAVQAKVAADHAEELFWKDFVLDIVQEGVGAFTSIKNSKSWSKMSDASKKRVEQQVEELQYKYGDSYTIEDKSPAGHKRVTTYRTHKQHDSN